MSGLSYVQNKRIIYLSICYLMSVYFGIEVLLTFNETAMQLSGKMRYNRKDVWKC